MTTSCQSSVRTQCPDEKEWRARCEATVNVKFSKSTIVEDFVQYVYSRDDPYEG